MLLFYINVSNDIITQIDIQGFLNDKTFLLKFLQNSKIDLNRNVRWSILLNL